MLQGILGDRYTEINSLSNLDKNTYVLGSEMWTEDFSYLLSAVNKFIVELWELHYTAVMPGWSSGPVENP